MTPEEVNTLWGKVIDDLQGEAGVKIMGEIGENMQARIVQRITETGLSADGVSFQSIKPYSPGYKKKKEEYGRYKGYVDFQLTGEMWKSVQVLRGSATFNEVEIGSIGGGGGETVSRQLQYIDESEGTRKVKVPKSKKPKLGFYEWATRGGLTNDEKLDVNAEHWHTHILALSEEEKDVATSQYIDSAVQVFRKHGL